jgi:2-methylcitrate dehydratase PrpD
MGATEAVVRFASQTRFPDIPQEAVANAKLPFLDIIGLMLAGSTEPCSGIARDFIREIGGAPSATIIGSGFRSSQPNAAFANGIAAHAPESDDADFEVLAHPSPVLVPTILAVGEACGSSGKEILEAYIIGWEVIGGIGRAVQVGFDHAVRGWQATGTLGTFGAAVAAAKLLKLNPDQMRMALGIAGAEASGTMQHWGTMGEPFIAGNSARNGVVAAVLARQGFTACPTILESRWGFFNVYSTKGIYEPERVARKMGNPYTFVSPGALIKKYGCIAPIQVPLEAMQNLVKRERFVAEEVESIEDGVSPQLKNDDSYPEPADAVQARYSVSYSIAAGVVYPELVGLAPYEEERVRNPRVKELYKKIRLYVHPDLVDMEPSKSLPVNYLKVRLKDGREFSLRAETAGGFPGNPLTKEELVAKYRYCAEKILPGQKIDRSIELIDNLEKLPDVGELVRALDPHP